jgi:hypothetical protein
VGNYRFLLVNDNGTNCSSLSYDDCKANYSYLGYESIVIFSMGNAPIVMPPFNFLGSTTPVQLMATVIDGVQTTGGTAVWPLMGVVGLPIAFVIAGYLVWLINKELTPVKPSKETINPAGDDIVYHSAADLEFKREYGQEKPKRKRGRPRKNL